MKFLAIDGNSLVNRAFYGVRDLSNSKKFPTNAIFGFYSMVEKILSEENFEYIVAAFDCREPTFRHKQYEKYKANRHKMPNELAIQFPEIKRLLALLGISICEKIGFEADDILGTLANFFCSKKIDCCIATGDRDSFQLIKKGIVVRFSSNKEAIYYDEDRVLTEYCVQPGHLLEVKALMGDSSDNIPGIRGIGEKTALKLISKFKTIDYIFKNLESLDISAKVKKLLSADGAEKICRLSRELGKISTTVPLARDCEQYRRRPINYSGLIEFLKEFELKKFLAKYYDLYFQKIKKNSDVDQFFQIFKDPDFEVVLKKLENSKYLDFYFNDEGNLYIFSEREIFEFCKLKVEAFKEIISKTSKLKRTNNLKDVYWFCEKNGLTIEGVILSCDIAFYLIDVNEKDCSLHNAADSFCFGENLPFCFPKLCYILQEKLVEKKLNFLFEEIEMPIARILFCMEKIGFAIDLESLKNFEQFLVSKIDLLKKDIYEFCGEIFNINSTKELGRILFEKLKLKIIKKTKTGYSTDAEVLEKLVKYSPVALMLLDYRSLTKLESTYVIGLKKSIAADKRIHSFFNQTQTKTGRISSAEPNIQNIPVRTEIGRKMRNFFVAGNGKVLIDADYSQIELRILAEMSKDLKLIEAFKKGKDIHNLTASEIFGFDYDDVPYELRRRAKIINFSVIYGISAFSLSKELQTSVIDARNYITSFFNSYSSVKKYFDETIASAKETGFVRTMFGRIRAIEELKSKNKNIYLLGERIAKNTPIQGSCADIIKLAMVKIASRLKLEMLNAKMILQVHDELLVESGILDCDRVVQILREEMESCVELKLPLVVNISIGENWGNVKKI